MYKDGDKLPCMNIELTDEKTSIFESKVGGLGYIPHDAQFPETESGEQLRLLAQIDCSQIDLDDYPKSGLLQFWIGEDDVYGMDFDDQTRQNGFRVLYYPEVDRSVTEDEVRAKVRENPDADEDFSPVYGEYGMAITKSESTFYDFELEKYADMEADPEDCGGHRVGGFPHFTQYDPRYDGREKYDTLLFQLDSDFNVEGGDRVLWGDCGIGNFFIQREKLKKLDFSDVLYNWDCC